MICPIRQRRRIRVGAVLVVLGAIAAGCTSYQGLSRQAQREVAVTEATVAAEASTRQDVAVVDHEALLRERLARDFPDLPRLGLRDALRIAARHNRDYADVRDANLRQGLELITARHRFHPRLHAAVSAALQAEWSDQPDAESTSRTLSGNVGATYLAPWGTSVAVDIDASVDHDLDGAAEDDRRVDGAITITQPLLRGGGRLTVRESLTQAERDLLYRLRAFERFRQNLAVRIVDNYYGLIVQLQIIENSALRLEQAEFLYQRARALFNAGRVPEIDVFRAQQEKLQAENNLRDARESYSSALDQFRILLGVPQDLPLQLPADVQPPLVSVALDPEVATRQAWANRLDLATLADRIADARRGVRIAAHELLPRLDLSLSANTAADGEDAFDDAWDDRDARAQITLRLPLDRVNRLADARRAALSADEVARQYRLAREEIAANVKSQLRNLERIEQSTDVQRRIIEAAQKRLAVAEIRFRLGQRSSETVVDAQNDLLVARNRYVRFVVDHAVAAMRLHETLGTLTVSPDGIPGVLPLPQPLPPEAQLPRPETEDAAPDDVPELNETNEVEP